MDENEYSSPHGMTVCLYHYGLCQSIKSLKESITVAKTELERRLEGMNEFRAQLDRQAGLFVNRAELVIMLDKIDLRIGQLAGEIGAVKSQLRENKGANMWTGYILTVVLAAVVSIALHFITSGGK